MGKCANAILMAPKKSDAELLKKLITLRDEAIKYRKEMGWDSMAQRGLSYYLYGYAQDNAESIETDARLRVANYVFSNIEAIKARVFDRLPGFQFLPRSEDDVGRAELTDSVMQYEMDHADMESLLNDYEMDALIYSFGIIKITWNYDESGADGLQFELVCPINFWVTAGDKDLATAQGCFECLYLSPDRVKKLYKVDLKPDAYIATGNTNEKKNVKNKCKVWQYTGSLEGEEQIVIFTEHKMLKTQPYYGHGRKPYVFLPNYKLPHLFYPLNEVFELEPLQDEMTEIDVQASEYRKRAINPKRLVQKGTVDALNMTKLKDPKQNVVEVLKLDGIREYVPAAIGGDIYNFRGIKKEDIGLTTGISEISRGGTERTVQTATGQSIISEATAGRIRQKVRQLASAYKEILAQSHALLSEFQDTAKNIRITGNPEAGQYGQYTKKDIQGNYDIVIDIVDAMSFLREKRAKLALDLYAQFKGDPDIDQIGLKKKTLRLGFQDISADNLLVQKAPEPVVSPIPTEAPQDLMTQLPPELMGQPQLMPPA